MHYIVYGVTQGIYSDYHVCAIFDDEKKAEDWRDKKNREKGRYGDDYEIEEFDFNPED